MAASLPVKTGLPDGLELPPGYTFEWAAVDPATGVDVTGVVVSATSIFGTPEGDGPIGDTTYKPVLLRSSASAGA